MTESTTTGTLSFVKVCSVLKDTVWRRVEMVKGTLLMIGTTYITPGPLRPLYLPRLRMGALSHSFRTRIPLSRIANITRTTKASTASVATSTKSGHRDGEDDASHIGVLPVGRRGVVPSSRRSPSRRRGQSLRPPSPRRAL